MFRWLILLSCSRALLGIFEQCNHVLRLEADQKVYINSPYYPAEYPLGSSCRYTVQAPRDYKLSFRCDIKMNTPSTDMRCQLEALHYNAESDELLTNTEYFCGNGNFERTSFLNRAVISYISKPLPQRNNGVALKTAQILLKDKHKATRRRTVTQRPKYKVNSNVIVPEYEDLMDELLNVLHDVGVDDALAYIASFLYNVDNEFTSKSKVTKATEKNNLPIVTWLRNRTITNTFIQNARIVTTDAAATYNASAGGGTFSCLVEAVEQQCNCGWSRPLKIVATGTEAGISEFPAMAGVLSKKTGMVFCGATIIQHRYLLSAAHCFSASTTGNPALISIVVGEHDRATLSESFYTYYYDIEAIIPHEQFGVSSKNGALQNDIALLRTRIDIEWNRNVGPACLPFRYYFLVRRQPPVAGTQVIVAGWGTTSYGGMQSQRLLKTKLDVISPSHCRQLLTSAPSAYTFCTYTPGHDTCQYDSGGALYERYAGRLVAVGIVSYGYACATQKPSINTRIAAYLQWIRTKTPQVKYCIK